MPPIDPSTHLVFYPLQNRWIVELPDGTTRPFPGGWRGRVAAMEFITEFNASSVATA